MKLFYWQETGGNFGDDLNPWLWPKLLPGFFDDDASTIFVGIGSILTQEALPDAPSKVVFGTGAWLGKPAPRIDERFKIYCVRGPLSAKLLGLPPEMAICDGAVLARLFCDLGGRKEHKVSFIPHHLSAKFGGWDGVCTAAGVHFIDIAGPVEKVLDEIRASELVITEALHGAIVADALRVPWVPVKAYGHILDFKWADWTQSLEIDYEPRRLPMLWKPGLDASFWGRARYAVKRRWAAAEIRRRARTARPCLSTDRAFNGVLARLEERLHQLMLDYAVKPAVVGPSA